MHLSPRDDTDAFVTSPNALSSFVLNRAAAARSLGKPLVLGEFNVPAEGFNGLSQAQWFRAYFDAAARWQAGGAMFWILTHAAERAYGVHHDNERDAPLRAEFARAARLLDSTAAAEPPPPLRDAGRHLVPHQFAFARAASDDAARPEIKTAEEKILYRFAPEQAARGRFEKLGSGPGYVWGAGVGFFEYVIPAREDGRRVGEIVVRAHLQPVLPHDGRGRFSHTRVTLFINDRDCGSRLVPVEQAPKAEIQEWRPDSWLLRLAASRGREMRLRFEVETDADQPFGVNISNFPSWFKDWETKPIEVEVR